MRQALGWRRPRLNVRLTSSVHSCTCRDIRAGLIRKSSSVEQAERPENAVVTCNGACKIGEDIAYCAKGDSNGVKRGRGRRLHVFVEMLLKGT